MASEQVIAARETILNELLDGLIRAPEGMTSAQAFRQMALKIFMENDIHHRDLVNVMSDFMKESVKTAKFSVKEIQRRFVKYYEDVHQLTKIERNSFNFYREAVTSKQATEALKNNFEGTEFNNLEELFETRIKLTANSFPGTSKKKIAEYLFNAVLQDLCFSEFGRDIRHVFPESLEQRVMMNHGDELIELLETGNTQNVKLDVEMPWDFVPSDEAITGVKKYYEPPKSVQQWRDMQRAFMQEFPNKAREYILGRNVFHRESTNRRGVMDHDFYYQYMGLNQVDEAVPMVYLVEKLLGDLYEATESRLANQYFAAAMAREGLDADLDMTTRAREIGLESRARAREVVKAQWDGAVGNKEIIQVESALPSFFDVSSDGKRGRWLGTDGLFGYGVSDEGLTRGRIYDEVIEIRDGIVTPTEIDTPTGVVDVDTPTNVLETFNTEDYKPFNIEVVDPAGLHMIPSKNLVSTLKDNGLKLLVLEDGKLVEKGLIYLVTEAIPQGQQLTIYVPKDLSGVEGFQEPSKGFKAVLGRGTLRTMDDTSISIFSDRVRNVAQEFHSVMGLDAPEFKPIMVFNDEIGAAAADIFQNLPMFDEAAIPLYKKFIQETNMQYQMLLDAGIEFELVDVDPYTPNKAGHQLMIADMENGKLKVLATSQSFGDGATSNLNPMLSESRYQDVNGRIMLENDVFRAVHDTFGHGMRGNTFGPIGEYNAWLAHKEMYSQDARRVMTTETLGQNTFTNYGPHMRDANGNLLGRADAGYIPPADRPFASQKVAIMPDEIIEVAGTTVDDAADIVTQDGVNKTAQLANTNPEISNSLWNTSKKVVGKLFNTAAGIADPGDVVITQGLARTLPRIGLAAIAAPALYAYIFYELSVLTVDAAQAFDKGLKAQNIELLDYDNTNPDIDWKQLGKDTWSEFGDISDTWSLSWKISEPIIDYAFNEAATLMENR
tara:strand:- start:3951 stop:6794 length:2844 start_codon:yes stop_codon:yes gene_type:complete